MALDQHVEAEHLAQRLGLQHLVRRAVTVWPPALQQEDTVTVARRQVEVVQDHQHRRALAGEIAHGLQGGVLVQWVEGRSRLVEQQHLPCPARPQLRQHPRQVHALALAARQRQVAAPAQVLGVCGTQRRLDDFAIAYAAAGMRQAPHADHVEYRKGEIQGRTLRQHGQAPRTLLAGPGTQRAPVQGHAAGGGLQLATEGTEQRALAGPVGAEHAEHLARLQVQVDIGQHGAGPAPDTEIIGTQHQARPRTSR